MASFFGAILIWVFKIVPQVATKLKKHLTVGKPTIRVMGFLLPFRGM
jgi:hypothetical protein